MATNLQISATLQQTADPNQLQLNDTTPVYSTGTPYGWNNSATDYTTNVYSVSLNSCVFYGVPANVPPALLGNVELMPSPNALPYVLSQAYILTPSMFGLPNFNNGILSFVYTINTATSYDIPVTSSTGFHSGDVITDNNTGKIIGTVSSVISGILVLSPSTLTGNLVTLGDAVTNGTTTTGATANGYFVNPNTYTFPIQFGDLALVEWNMGKKLACIDLTECGCDCNEVKVVFNQVMKPIVIANAQLGAAQNKSALNSIFIAQANSCNLLV